MGFKAFIQNTVLRMDLLSTSPSFRVRGEGNYETIFGGLFSFLMMSGFAYVLYIQFVSMFSNLLITYSQGVADDITSDSSINSIQMAVSIDGVDFSVSPKKFRCLLNHISISPVNGIPTMVSTPVNLTPCKLANWVNIGNNFEQQFTAFGFNQMLCIDSNASYSLSGYIGSTNYNYLTF